jgi:hypothetical protein
MAEIEYNIDFGKILAVALKGVRRATVFLGLGLNAALDPEFNKYQLPKLQKYSSFLQTLTLRPLPTSKTSLKLGSSERV